MIEALIFQAAHGLRQAYFKLALILKPFKIQVAYK